MKNVFSYCIFAFSAFLFMSATGCGDGRPRCYPVQGVVQVDGKPLTGEFDGTIRFVHVTDTQKGRPATGKIGSDGRFSLTSYEDNDGCPKGKYQVELIVLRFDKNKTYYLVPPRYENHATSGIEVEITGKTTDLTISAEWTPKDSAYKKPIVGSDGAS